MRELGKGERVKENVLRILGSQSEIHHWDPHTANGVMILADHGSWSIPQLTPLNDLAEAPSLGTRRCRISFLHREAVKVTPQF